MVNDLLRDKGLMLKAGTVVDATLIAAPSSTKNASGERDLKNQAMQPPRPQIGSLGRIDCSKSADSSWSRGYSHWMRILQTGPRVVQFRPVCLRPNRTECVEFLVP